MKVYEMPTMAVIGVGRAGTALCAGLARARLPLMALASKRIERAEELATALAINYGCKVRAVELSEVTRAADIVFLATPDSVIKDVAGAIPWQQGKMAVHLSGAATLETLTPASLGGAAVASFHPLNTFPAVVPDQAGLSVAAQALASCHVAVAASDTQVEELLARVAALVSQGHFVVPDADRALYHAAAVFASNFVTGLVGTSLALWREIGFSERQALDYMSPLLSAACANTLRLGPRQALTGPAARGDIATVAKHLAALHELPNAQASSEAVYRALTLSLLPLARDAGTLSPEAEERLRQLLNKENEHA